MVKRISPPVELANWTNPRTGEISQVPVGVHPAFAYNPGTLRPKRLQALVLDKIAALDAELAAALKAELAKPTKGGGST